jgi:hypothetical protein
LVEAFAEAAGFVAFGGGIEDDAGPHAVCRGRNTLGGVMAMEFCGASWSTVGPLCSTIGPLWSVIGPVVPRLVHSGPLLFHIGPCGSCWNATKVFVGRIVRGKKSVNAGG